MQTTELRARVAARLSALYASEVPAYGELVDACRRINEAVLRRDGHTAERLGSLSRVTAERHGAIRVGTPNELRQAALIFGALGMQPTGFYDLRTARPRPIPVVSTAFRPRDAAELAANPFRVFVSVLVPEDRRFFDEDLGERLITRLNRRELFPPRLLELATRAEHERGLVAADADEFVDLLASALELSDTAVDRGWYEELTRVSDVAADIGGVDSTHINHLTPRVLDIDELYAEMTRGGIEMIDSIQGPPRWEGPDVLLRQTSFRALAEGRRFREADGTTVEGSLRVRFGEVEARGIALTPAGRDVYDRSVAAATDSLAEAASPADRAAALVAQWQEAFPRTEAGLREQELAYFEYDLVDGAASGAEERRSLDEWVDAGVVRATPIVYEDFLPRSAAGIFNSNLTGAGGDSLSEDAGVHRDQDWLSGVIGRPVADPAELYAAQQSASIRRLEDKLGMDLAPPPVRPGVK